MNACSSPLNDLCRGKQGKVLQPKARRFRLSMTEHPRLDNLIRLSNTRTDNGDRILKCNSRNPSLKQRSHEVKRLCLFFLLVLKPPRTTHRKMRTRRVSNHQIPSFVQIVVSRSTQNIQYVSLDVFAWCFAREQIHTDRLVSACRECVTNNAGEFACDKDSQPAACSRSTSFQCSYSAASPSSPRNLIMSRLFQRCSIRVDHLQLSLL